MSPSVGRWDDPVNEAIRLGDITLEEARLMSTPELAREFQKELAKIQEEQMTKQFNLKNGDIEFHMLSGDYFEVEAPYKPELVQIFKDVPGKDRYWDKSRKRWGFLKKWESVLRDRIYLQFAVGVEYIQASKYTLDQTMMDQIAIVNEAKKRAKTQMIKEHLDPLKITT